jgi:hypothetical protein
MSTKHVVLLLSLAACERANLATQEPQFAPPPPAPAPPAPAPVASEPVLLEGLPEVVPEAPAPAVAPAKPQLYFGKQSLDGELDRRCMSRAGCRWKGEREAPRVVKKPAPVTLEPATTE